MRGERKYERGKGAMKKEAKRKNGRRKEKGGVIRRGREKRGEKRGRRREERRK